MFGADGLYAARSAPVSLFKQRPLSCAPERLTRRLAVNLYRSPLGGHSRIRTRGRPDALVSIGGRLDARLLLLLSSHLVDAALPPLEGRLDAVFPFAVQRQSAACAARRFLLVTELMGGSVSALLYPPQGVRGNPRPFCACGRRGNRSWSCGSLVSSIWRRPCRSPPRLRSDRRCSSCCLE